MIDVTALRGPVPRAGTLLAFVLVAACGGSEGPEAGEGADPPSESAAAAPDTAPSGIVPRLSPASGAVGSQVTLTAAGLPAGAEIEIGFGAPQESFEVLTRVNADAQGNLSSVVTVPSWAQAGREYRFVIARVDQPPLGLSRVFRVTAP
jgi:hypothetical protein